MKLFALVLAFFFGLAESQTVRRYVVQGFGASDSVSIIALEGPLTAQGLKVWRVNSGGTNWELATPTGTGAPVNAVSPTFTGTVSGAVAAWTGAVSVADSLLISKSNAAGRVVIHATNRSTSDASGTTSLLLGHRFDNIAATEIRSVRYGNWDGNTANQDAGLNFYTVSDAVQVLSLTLNTLGKATFSDTAIAVKWRGNVEAGVITINNTSGSLLSLASTNGSARQNITALGTDASPQITYALDAGSLFTTGVNDASSDRFEIVEGGTLGSNVRFHISVGGTVTVPGAAVLQSTLGLTGDFAVNTNKFNVTASSGNTAIAGTLGVTGLITVTDAMSFPTTSASGGGAGRIYKSATQGLTMYGITGSTNDLALVSASGTVVARVPTGTNNFSVPGTFTAVTMNVDGAATFDNTVNINAAAGTGTRLVTATSSGGIGNATTIAGAYTFSNKIVGSDSGRFDLGLRTGGPLFVTGTSTLGPTLASALAVGAEQYFYLNGLSGDTYQRYYAGIVSSTVGGNLNLEQYDDGKIRLPTGYFEVNDIADRGTNQGGIRVTMNNSPTSSSGTFDAVVRASLYYGSAGENVALFKGDFLETDLGADVVNAYGLWLPEIPATDVTGEVMAISVENGIRMRQYGGGGESQSLLCIYNATGEIMPCANQTPWE